MNNKYSRALLWITGIILTLSMLWILFLPSGWNFIGTIPFIFGVLMVYHGFQSPETKQGKSTKKVWLLTYFGQQTDIKVTGLTFICNWLPIDILDYVEVDLKKNDKTFQATNILCKKMGANGALEDDGYVSGPFSSTYSADDSTAATLWDYVNAGGEEGINRIVEGIVPQQTQEIAKIHDNEWMETHSKEVAIAVLAEVMGIGNVLETTNPTTNPDTDDTRGIGVKFYKFTALLKPVQAVMDARNDRLTEEAERVGDLLDNQTNNTKIVERLKISRQGLKDPNGNIILSPDARPLTVAEAQDQVMAESALKKDKYSRVENRNGLNVIELQQRGGRP